MRISGGLNNSFTNDGTVDEIDAHGTALLADGGNNTVNNFGVIKGSIVLGPGINVFNQNAGAVLESGKSINLSATGVFNNAGTISPGGMGTVLTTALTGNFTQTGDAIWIDDLNPDFTSDQFSISGKTSLGNFKNTINLNQVDGVANAPGAYTIITAASGLTGSFQLGAMTGFTMPNGLTYTLANTDTQEQVLLRPSSGPFYWSGAVGSAWNTDFANGQSNLTADAAGSNYVYGTPGVASDVYFASTVSSTINSATMTEDYSINSLTVLANATAVTINGTNTLTIAATNGTGITLNSGAPVTTINDNIVLANNQAWTNNSADPLNINGTAITSAANNNLVVQGTGLTNLFSQLAIGSGSLTKSGAGTVILYNTLNNYQGGTFITGGNLAVNSAGALGRGNVTNTSGTLQTTSNLGGIAQTINVAGNYRQALGGTLLLQVVSSPSPTPSSNAGVAGVDYDNLAVAGSAQVAGTLALNFGPNAVVAPGQRFVSVTAGTSITGTFDTSVSNLPLDYFAITTNNDTFNGTVAANSTVVTFMRPFTTFSSELNPNQMNTAHALDQNINALLANGSLAYPNGVVADFLDNIITGLNESVYNEGGLGRSLDQLSPLKLQLFETVSFNNAAFAIQQLDGHMANLRYGASGLDTSGFAFDDPTMGALSAVKSRLLAWEPTATPGLLSDSGVPLLDALMASHSEIDESRSSSAFISGNAVLANINANANVSNSSYTTTGVTVGADHKITKHLSLGGFFNYNHTSADLDNQGSKGRIDSYTAGIYATYADDGWFANGLASYSHNSYSESRNIMFPGVNRTATGSSGGNQVTADLDGGYEFHLGHWTVGPTAGLNYTHLEINSFGENNAGAANLNIQQQSADSMRSLIGLGTRYGAKYLNADFNYHLNASWQHEYTENSTGISSSFAVPGATSFVVHGPGPDRNSLLLDAGTDVQVSNRVDIFFDYMVQANQGQYFGQSVQGGVKIGF